MHVEEKLLKHLLETEMMKKGNSYVNITFFLRYNETEIIFLKSYRNKRASNLSEKMREVNELRINNEMHCKSMCVACSLPSVASQL